jgi:hypothetical protein
MTQDPFYWPAALPKTTTWPPQTDIDSNNAGGGGIGIGANGNLPVGDTSGITSTGAVFVGGPNVVFRGRSDWGDPTPTDFEFKAQALATAQQFQAIWAVLRPMLNMKSYRLKDSDPMPVSPDPPTPITIDLWKTKVTDARTGSQQQFGYLSDLLKLVAGSGGSGGSGTTASGGTATVMVDGTAAKVVTADKTDGAPFDFKYDANGKKVGAGTALVAPAGPAAPVALVASSDERNDRWPKSGFRAQSSTLGP